MLEITNPTTRLILYCIIQIVQLDSRQLDVLCFSSTCISLAFSAESEKIFVLKEKGEKSSLVVLSQVFECFHDFDDWESTPSYNM